MEAARSEGPTKIPSMPGVATIASTFSTAVVLSTWTNSEMVVRAVPR